MWPFESSDDGCDGGHLYGDAQSMGYYSLDRTSVCVDEDGNPTSYEDREDYAIFFELREQYKSICRLSDCRDYRLENRRVGLIDEEDLLDIAEEVEYDGF